SEERRVGKECRSRGPADHRKKKKGHEVENANENRNINRRAAHQRHAHATAPMVSFGHPAVHLQHPPHNHHPAHPSPHVRRSSSNSTKMLAQKRGSEVPSSASHDNSRSARPHGINAASAPNTTARIMSIARIDTAMSAVFFFSSRRRHTSCLSDWSSDVCSSDLTLTRTFRFVGFTLVEYTRSGRILVELLAGVIFFYIFLRRWTSLPSPEYFFSTTSLF